MCILLADHPTAQLGSSLGILVLFTAFGLKYQPFLSHELDLVEEVSKICCTVTVLVAMCIRLEVAPTLQANGVYAGLINFANIFTAVFFCLMMA